jgi:hypothetical protein
LDTFDRHVGTFPRGGLNVFAYNKADGDASVTALLRMGVRVPFKDIAEMARGILDLAAKGDRISALHIVDHGIGSGTPWDVHKHGRWDRKKKKPIQVVERGGVANAMMGDDVLSVQSFPTFEADLKSLRGVFTPDGWVYMHNCYVGRDTNLLALLARALGVGVSASTEKVRSVTGMSFGYTVSARPDGSITIAKLPLSLF